VCYTADLVQDNGSTNGNGTDVTLHDVITHITNMKQQFAEVMKVMESHLISRIDDMESRLTVKIDANTEAIAVLTQRVDALEEDLVATIEDTLRIRGHVGMPVPTGDE